MKRMIDLEEALQALDNDIMGGMNYVQILNELPDDRVYCKDCINTVPHWYRDPVSGKKVVDHFCTVVESDVEEYQYCWWGEDKRNVRFSWNDINGDGTAWKCMNCGEISCCNSKYCPECGSRMKVEE